LDFLIPYILNGAYAVDRMPISMKETKADFISGSEHKSIASAGPVGVLGMKKRFVIDSFQVILNKYG
jgi:Sep-tRNA:Cys-tRNA synthetase